MSTFREFPPARPLQNSIPTDEIFSLSSNVRRIQHLQTISIWNITFKQLSKCDSVSISESSSGRVLKLNENFANERKYDNLPAKMGNRFQQSVRFDNQLTVFNQESPIQRQEVLQRLSQDTFFDTFYTLNKFMNVNNPFYISRVFHECANIQEDVDFNAINEKSLTLNLFINYKGKWRLLIQYHIMLPLMKCIGSDVKQIRKLFWKKPNFLTINLSDDCCYILPDTDVSNDMINALQKTCLQKLQQRTNLLYHSGQTTCTYDQIMKLNNLSTCIKDILDVKKSVCYRLHRSAKKQTNKKGDILSKISILRSTLNSRKLYNLELSQLAKHLQSSVNKKKMIIDNLLNLSLKFYPKPKIDVIKKKLQDYLSLFDQVLDGLNIEKARIAKDLLYIFPMKRVSMLNGSSLKRNYELLGYRFPPAPTRHKLLSLLMKLQRAQILKLSALTGYISYIICLYARYLQINLRYPIHYMGSRSYIRDFISPKATNNNVFPLFITQNATLVLKYTYGLMLLTSDLEQLFNNERLHNIEDLNLLFNLHTFLQGMSNYGTDVTDFADSISKHGSKQFFFGAGTELLNPSERIAISRRTLNETLASQERERHIRKHLLDNIDDI